MKKRLETMIAIIENDAAMFDMYFRDDKAAAMPALLAAEDHRGHLHRGIDYRSLARAFIRFLMGARLRGLSTIEQQYVRLIERRRGSLILCKLRELWFARNLWRRTTKEQIWCGYLWRAYFGAHMLGYSQARAYYSKEHLAIDLKTAAAIVACLKYPRPKRPTDAWSAKHQRRVEYVLGRMKRLPPVKSLLATSRQLVKAVP